LAASLGFSTRTKTALKISNQSLACPSSPPRENQYLFQRQKRTTNVYSQKLLFGSSGANRLVAEKQPLACLYHHHGRFNDRSDDKRGPLSRRGKSRCLEVVEQIHSLQTFGSAKFGKQKHESKLRSIPNQQRLACTSSPRENQGPYQSQKKLYEHVDAKLMLGSSGAKTLFAFLWQQVGEAEHESKLGYCSKFRKQTRLKTDARKRMRKLE
jgi:hypothetical protein